MKYKEKIDTIIENFDFEKVELVMSALGWHWSHADGTCYKPTVVQLKEMAHDLLNGACHGLDVEGEGSFYNRSGGFDASAYVGEDNEVQLRLVFCATEWDTEDN